MSPTEPAASQKNRVPDRLDLILALWLGLISFGIYARTLFPGLVPNDGAEFQTLAYTLDHAHTTGYEVYMILARLFVFLPVGEVAYRVNLFSAFMTGVTVTFLYLAAKTVSGSRWDAALAAAGLAVSLFAYLREKMRSGRLVYTAERLDELQRGGFSLRAVPVGVSEMFLIEEY